MKQVLRYLKYNQNYTLHYNKYLPVIELYDDTNWITQLHEVKSTSKYIITIGEGVMS